MPARGLSCAGTNCITRAIRRNFSDKLRLSLNSNFHSWRERHPVFGGPLRSTDSESDGCGMTACIACTMAK